MKKFTFTTECDFDNSRAEALLKSLDAKIKNIHYSNNTWLHATPDFPENTVFMFNVASDHSLTDIQEMMKKAIQENEEFADLHRCFQTLERV